MPDGVEDVVRDVMVVIQLANGSSPSLPTTEFVELIPQEPLPEQER